MKAPAAVGLHKRKPGNDAPGFPWVPFPTQVLPSPLDDFVRTAGRSLGCDESYVALPLLAACAQAIGTTRRVALKKTWAEPAIIWTVLVGKSGTRKSPALELALRPLQRRQRIALGRWKLARRDYEIALDRYAVELAGWRTSREGEPPPRPQEPQPTRYIIGDINVETLAEKLQSNPRGLLLVRDELGGWFARFDRHAANRGADLARWLEMHGGRQLTIDRKTGDPRLIFVPQAAVSVTGGIPPRVLRRYLATEHLENGLAPRLLLVYPPPMRQTWTEDDVDPDLEARIEELSERLFRLDFEGHSQRDGSILEPVILPLSTGAKQIWISFYNEQRAAISTAEDDLAAAFSKLEGYAARFALIIQLVRDAASEEVNHESMRRGIELARWFNRETQRVYATLREGLIVSVEEDLILSLRRRGGRISVRELQRSSRRYRSAREAEAVLQKLADHGLGRWTTPRTSSRGGRPSRVLEISPVDLPGQTGPHDGGVPSVDLS